MRLQPPSSQRRVKSPTEFIECKKCNKSFDEDFDYCPYCGAETVHYRKYCKSCREFIGRKDFEYCPDCGTKLRYYFDDS